MSISVQTSDASPRQSITLVLIGSAILFIILQFGVTWLAGLWDQTWAALVITAFMLAVAVLLEKLFFRHNLSQGLSTLGLGRPHGRAILAALIIVLFMLAFFPIFSLTTGAQISLKSDWLWILLAIVTFNGIGEETLFRSPPFQLAAHKLQHLS